MKNKLFKSLLLLCTLSSSSMLAFESASLTKTITNVKSDYFDTAYRSAKIGFPNLTKQNQHQSKYKAIDADWSGPMFDAYWGRDYPYPFTAQQIMKDSPVSDFSLGFLNNLYTEDETHNLGAGYVDSIQEIHALGGHVTISFGGGTPSETSFFNNDPSADVMYKHLLDTALAFHVNSYDFDVEGVHTLQGNDAKSLGMALAKLRTTLKTKYHETLHVRFTRGSIGDYLGTFTKYLGSDFVWDDITWTEYHQGFDKVSFPDFVEYKLQQDERELKANPAFAKMSDFQIYHHLGLTDAIQRDEISISDFHKLMPWALKNGLGLMSIWLIGYDHKVNSPLNPTEHTDQTQDFAYSKMIQDEFSNPGYAPSSINKLPIPGQVSGVRLYSKSQKYISLKWNPVKNARYYVLKDSQGNVITQTQRCFGALSFGEYPSMKVVGTHTFTVTAVNSSGQGIASKPLPVTISSKLINNQIEYWDANINYTNIVAHQGATPATWVPYIYYQGNIYQDINHSKQGILMNDGTPKTNTKDWKLLGPANDSRFGLSQNRINDLKNFEWDDYINKTDPITYVNFKKGQDTSKMIPNINDFLYPIIKQEDY